ncbi:OadG family protein [Marinomonas posidonica]|uniref:Probable oxaloacetate decarboxylase gamma chain n=1 Tax=Marinomonas posidonica (strain CECT 7376 / NCIMB 14433 / IVIA-Po-181) TaxID=491952 RepID=F6D112_MARPP|nr:OadG family transporter subunit [Marinomonas posidonica]AEF53735.1 oxaloacetate decarboxylase gamma chain [Marinomonas posidonica IVIA-Po-181]
MNELVSEGIGLMVLGMGFVFVFLVVLIFATGYMSSIINKFFPEVVAVAESNIAMSNSVTSTAVDPQIAAAITAAIHQHRNK